ncbi:uncharacterized protein BJ171DRAFT_426808 [Polychytrium aggregatum]|uniref:uncharacterized protein n=1 Tax=Polychytrium aggregatum TaxID=110093 RepID=UPI0022FED149|nr:uncharacterized protein BJ171DRAFT_426808 [Polychytrium aggregatum]KAI9202230.1 hypothetical protein BJ171DRAFT_426808 [Polychytrium aggregatum]
MTRLSNCHALVDRGIPQAPVGLGRWYENGEGIDRDWLCKHFQSIYLIEGFGTAVDQARASSFLRQLAHDGHSDSRLWLGWCHRYHWGVVTAWLHASRCFSKSANQDYPYGQFMVGYSYFNQIGVPRDYTRAIEWYRKSADQNLEWSIEGLKELGQWH